jgi:1-aminocyclopropane-1-carboxylate deaminase
MFTNIYSPLEKLAHPKLQQLWIKRDDLMDPYISGNKWRKLKYILEHAALSKKTHLVTFGGAYSNHLLATAAAAARASFQSSAFVRGDAINNEMLLLCKLYGMKLIFTDRTSYKDKKKLYNQHFGDDSNALFIDEGGAGQFAVKGCAEIVNEFPEDVEHIFCAAGTGTTAAGLLRGIINNNSKAVLHVVPVLKAADHIYEQIVNFIETDEANNSESILTRTRYDGEQLKIHQDYHFGGYAKVDEKLIAFMKKFIRSTGILIDPVYTAKLFYAIDDLSKQGYFPEDEKIVALHTGGLMGIFGMKEKF